MRAVSESWGPTIARTHDVITEVTSWRGGVQLGDVMLPDDGELVFDATARLDRRATLSFAAAPEDLPDSPDHPLAAYGQRLHIRTGVRHPDSGVDELLDMGWYLITDWEWSEVAGVITVQAEALRRLLDDARLWSQTAATALGALTYTNQVTILSSFYMATGQELPVEIDPALSTSLAVQADRLYETDRTRELDQLALEWGAQWRTTDGGALRFAPVLPPLTAATPAAATVVDGEAGTLIDRAAAASRSRVANVLWVTGRTPSTGAAPLGGALWDPAVGDGLLWSGPYGQAVAHETNDALTTVAACRDFAVARLPRLVRPGVEVPIETLPDPSWQLDDVIAVQTADATVLGRVGSMRLPLTAAGGSMAVTLLAGDYGTAVPQ